MFLALIVALQITLSENDTEPHIDYETLEEPEFCDVETTTGDKLKVFPSLIII